MNWRLRNKISHAKFSIAALRLGAALVKYSPDQPRVPSGRPTGGQWVGINRVAGKWNEGRRAECELQYQSDIFQCRMMPWNPFCEDQARSRMTACMKGDPIPPFFHVGRR